MDAKDLPITTLLDGAKHFIVPIFERDYSWGTKECLALWNDIIRVGSDHNTKGHFLGSVVYIAAEENTADLRRWLLIDGQQQGIAVRHVDGKTVSPEDCRFLGVPPRLPRIQVGDPYQAGQAGTGNGQARG